MRKLILSAILFTSIAISSSGQDYSSFCSTTRTSDFGQTVAGKGLKAASLENGEFKATVDTLAGATATFTWSVPNFFSTPVAITDSVFTFTVKSSFNASFRIGILYDNFKTYDVPFATNKNLLAGSDYVTYSMTPNGTTSLSQKFQQVIFYIVPTADVTNGTISIQNFSYGNEGCSITGVTKSNSTVSSLIVFPNPSTNNQTNVEAILSSTKNVKIKVTTLLGNEIYASKETLSSIVSESINTSGWAKGLYSLNILTDGVLSKAEILVVQ